MLCFKNLEFQILFIVYITLNFLFAQIELTESLRLLQNLSVNAVNEVNIMNTENKEKAKKNTRKNNKYKIAIMGATRVGKTIFLGSYFNMVTRLALGKYSIEASKQSSAKRIAALVNQLFDEKKIGPGNSERVDFSFAVSTLNMDIELYDVPGGFTQDINDWEREGIADDLRRADGALFFISGEDLKFNPENISQDIIVFAKAISIIRSVPQNRKINSRSDVPISFIITKGDTIPDVPVETLEESIATLVKRAKDSHDKDDLIEGMLFAKGNFVKIYKTESMGKWPSSTVFPKEYQPTKVVEPMDDLFDAMYESRKQNRSVLKKLLAGGIAALLIALWIWLYIADHNNWNVAQDMLDKNIRAANYPAAEKILKEFKSPSFLSFIYPRFLRADRNINQGYEKYENALYTLIKSDMAAIDENTLPSINQNFLAASDRVEKYLSVENFANINSKHYEEIRGKKWYFDVVKLLNFDVETAENSPDKVMKVIRECLEQETPANWHEKVSVKIERLVRAWVRSLPLNVSPVSLDSYIAATDSLLISTKIPERLQDYLNEQKIIWRDAKQAYWHKIADEWISEAGAEQGDAIKNLEIKLKASPSSVVSERIKRAIFSTLQLNIGNELNQIQKYIFGFQQDGRFSDGKNKLSERCRTLTNSIAASAVIFDEDSRNSLLAPINEFETRLEIDLRKAHFNFCRQGFDRLKLTANANVVLEYSHELSDFINAWPQTDESVIAAKVLDYIRVIYNGVKTKITVVNGNFADIDAWTDTPDMYVTVTQNSKMIYKTNIIIDNVQPNWNESFDYTWKISDKPLRFTAFEADSTLDSTALEQEVSLSGIFGYENINITISKSAGCCMRISVSASVPDCPWR